MLTTCISAATKPTAVVAEDSDVLQLTVRHVNPAQFNIYLIMAKQSVCIWCKEADRPIPFRYHTHTRSRPYSFEKVTVLKKFELMKNTTKVFMDRAPPYFRRGQILQPTHIPSGSGLAWQWPSSWEMGWKVYANEPYSVRMQQSAAPDKLHTL